MSNSSDPRVLSEYSRRPLTPDDLWSMRVPSDPQLSPDGAQVAYVVTVPERASDDYTSNIWVVPAAGGTAHRLTNGPRDLAPRWSPDGRHLAFLARRGDNAPSQLYVLSTEGGEARALTEFALGAGEPVWSPDGSHVAFSAPVDLAASDTSPHAPIVAERLDYKADGMGLLGTHRSQLFTVDVVASTDPGTARQITFGDCSASTPVWSPDGTRLAYATSTGEDRDLDIAVVVHVVRVAGGAPVACSPADGVYSVFDWSPDAETLLVVGGPRPSPGNEYLYALPAQGGNPERLAPSLDRSVIPGGAPAPGAPPRYDAGGQRVLFCVRDRGSVHVLQVAARGGEPEQVIVGDRVVAGMSNAFGKIAFVAGDTTSPGEVWIRDADGAERRLTDLFVDALPDVRLVAPRPVTFEAPDGVELHGWIVRGEVDGATPLLVDIHGGPHNAWNPGFGHLYHQSLATLGWTILLLNPRGSDGYGDAFRTAAVGAWGRADEADFFAAIDALVAQGLADPTRVSVTGYSYGGYMTCWLTSRSSRFVSAVCGGLVSNLVSFAGTSDFGRPMAEVEMGAALSDHDALALSSPLAHAAAVTTPTLILQGEIDLRCPMSQAEEWFAALRDRRVPVQLVRYPGASHLLIATGRPSHRIDYARRLESWVTTYGARAHKSRRRDVVTGRQVSAGELQQRFGAMAAHYGVPGAVAAVLAGGQVTTAATGVLNVDTGVEVTTDSLFQIGSITKPYTASVVMQLVDEGRVDLDIPVVEFLPELELADPEVTRSVTLRHLLSHTSGIQGDHHPTPDPGRGDDSVARYVASCSEVGQLHPLGATMSYCNAGYVIAGRVIEYVTGKTWDQAMAERLFVPLGLNHTVTLPEEVLRFRAAMGHVGSPGSPLRPASSWGLGRGGGPAGAICASASDVVAFARMHLDDGAAPNGTQVLSVAAAHAMREPQVALPNDYYGFGSHWGLGWALLDWGGRLLFGHDGNTLSQSAYLRVIPDAEVAVALVTNCANTGDFSQEFFETLLTELAGVVMPARPCPPATPVEPMLDLTEHVGVYERLGVRIEVETRDGALVAHTTITGPLSSLVTDPVTEQKLVAVDANHFVTRQPGTDTWVPVVFYSLDDGSRYVNSGVRSASKVV